jgi:rsbT co-antagonist protein RsbR
MTSAIETSRAETLATNQRLEQTVQERTGDLELAVGRMEQLFEGQQTLLRTLREVSTPVIPVAAGVLVMPLIGQFDAARAQQVTRELLTRIERERAHTALVDVTGLPFIDAQVARTLMEAVSAARLLGATVVLVGVAPEVAQALVALGLDLGGIQTAPDVQSAVERAGRNWLLQNQKDML